MSLPARGRCPVLLLAAAVVCAPAVRATVLDPAERSIEQFLTQEARQLSYRGTRKLEAQNGDQRGWVEASTDYSPGSGFRYRITAEGGSGSIRSRVLISLLDGERDLVAKGADPRSMLALANYRFHANGIGQDGLANVLLAPRRKEDGLVSGTMFLSPDGALVRLEGRLAKSPSFWLKEVDIIRTYRRIAGVVLPIAFESRAQVRFLGEGSLRMTYAYSEVDGHVLTHE